MDLHSFTTADEAGDENETDEVVQNNLPATAAEEIDYLNKLLNDIEKCDSSDGTITRPRNISECSNKAEFLIQSDMNCNSVEEITNGNSNKNYVKTVIALQTQTDDKVNELSNDNCIGDTRIIDDNSRQIESNLSCETPKLSFISQSPFSDKNVSDYDMNNSLCKIVNVKRSVGENCDCNDISDQLSEEAKHNTRKVDSDNDNSCEKNIKLTNSGVETLKNLQYTSAERTATQSICKESENSELITLPAVTDKDIVEKPVKENITDNSTGHNELHHTDRAVETSTASLIFPADKKTVGCELSESLDRACCNLDSETYSEPIDTGRSEVDVPNIVTVESTATEAFGDTSSAYSDDDYIQISLPLNIACIKAEPEEMEEEFDLGNCFHDPAEEFNIDEVSVKQEVSNEEESTVDSVPCQGVENIDILTKAEPSDDETPAVPEQEDKPFCYTIPYIHYKTEEGKTYSKEQVSAAVLMSQTSLAKVIDMDMFSDVGSTFPIVFLYKLEYLFDDLQIMPFRDKDLIDQFFCTYGTKPRKWNKLFKVKSKGKHKDKYFDSPCGLSKQIKDQKSKIMQMHKTTKKNSAKKEKLKEVVHASVSSTDLALETKKVRERYDAVFKRAKTDGDTLSLTDGNFDGFSNDVENQTKNILETLEMKIKYKRIEMESESSDSFSDVDSMERMRETEHRKKSKKSRKEVSVNKDINWKKKSMRYVESDSEDEYIDSIKDKEKGGETTERKKYNEKKSKKEKWLNSEMIKKVSDEKNLKYKTESVKHDFQYYGKEEKGAVAKEGYHRMKHHKKVHLDDKEKRQKVEEKHKHEKKKHKSREEVKTHHEKNTSKSVQQKDAQQSKLVPLSVTLMKGNETSNEADKKLISDLKHCDVSLTADTEPNELAKPKNKLDTDKQVSDTQKVSVLSSSNFSVNSSLEIKVEGVTEHKNDNNDQSEDIGCDRSVSRSDQVEDSASMFSDASSEDFSANLGDQLKDLENILKSPDKKPSGVSVESGEKDKAKIKMFHPKSESDQFKKIICEDKMSEVKKYSEEINKESDDSTSTERHVKKAIHGDTSQYTHEKLKQLDVSDGEGATVQDTSTDAERKVEMLEDAQKHALDAINIAEMVQKQEQKPSLKSKKEETEVEQKIDKQETKHDNDNLEKQKKVTEKIKSDNTSESNLIGGNKKEAKQQINHVDLNIKTKTSEAFLSMEVKKSHIYNNMKQNVNMRNCKIILYDIAKDKRYRKRVKKEKRLLLKLGIKQRYSNTVPETAASGLQGVPARPPQEKKILKNVFEESISNIMEKPKKPIRDDAASFLKKKKKQTPMESYSKEEKSKLKKENFAGLPEIDFLKLKRFKDGSLNSSYSSVRKPSDSDNRIRREPEPPQELPIFGAAFRIPKKTLENKEQEKKEQQSLIIRKEERSTMSYSKDRSYPNDRYGMLMKDGHNREIMNEGHYNREVNRFQGTQEVPNSRSNERKVDTFGVNSGEVPGHFKQEFRENANTHPMPYPNSRSNERRTDPFGVHYNNDIPNKRADTFGVQYNNDIPNRRADTFGVHHNNDVQFSRNDEHRSGTFGVHLGGEVPVHFRQEFREASNAHPSPYSPKPDTKAEAEKPSHTASIPAFLKSYLNNQYAATHGNEHSDSSGSSAEKVKGGESSDLQQRVNSGIDSRVSYNPPSITKIPNADTGFARKPQLSVSIHDSPQSIIPMSISPRSTVHVKKGPSSSVSVWDSPLSTVSGYQDMDAPDDVMDRHSPDDSYCTRERASKTLSYSPDDSDSTSRTVSKTVSYSPDDSDCARVTVGKTLSSVDIVKGPGLTKMDSSLAKLSSAPLSDSDKTQNKSGNDSSRDKILSAVTPYNSKLLQKIDSLDKRGRVKLYEKYKSNYTIAHKRFYADKSDVRKNSGKLQKYKELNYWRKMYYDLKIYLFEQKKQSHHKRRELVMEKDPSVKKSSHPDQDRGNENEPYSPSASPVLPKMSEAEKHEKAEAMEINFQEISKIIKTLTATGSLHSAVKSLSTSGAAAKHCDTMTSSPALKDGRNIITVQEDEKNKELVTSALSDDENAPYSPSGSPVVVKKKTGRSADSVVTYTHAVLIDQKAEDKNKGRYSPSASSRLRNSTVTGAEDEKVVNKNIVSYAANQGNITSTHKSPTYGTLDERIAMVTAAPYSPSEPTSDNYSYNNKKNFNNLEEQYAAFSSAIDSVKTSSGDKKVDNLCQSPPGSPVEVQNVCSSFLSDLTPNVKEAFMATKLELAQDAHSLSSEGSIEDVDMDDNSATVEDEAVELQQYSEYKFTEGKNIRDTISSDDSNMHYPYNAGAVQSSVSYSPAPFITDSRVPAINDSGKFPGSSISSSFTSLPSLPTPVMPFLHLPPPPPPTLKGSQPGPLGVVLDNVASSVPKAVSSTDHLTRREPCKKLESSFSLATAFLLPPPPPPPIFIATPTPTTVASTTEESPDINKDAGPKSKFAELINEFFDTWEEPKAAPKVHQPELEIVYSNIENKKASDGLDEMEYYKKKPLAQGLIDKAGKIPLVGLQYILEVQKNDSVTEDTCSFVCNLCTKKMSSATLIAHVKSVPHRLKFAECYSKEIFEKFGKMEVKQWTQTSVKEFTAAISDLDRRIGRKQLAIVNEKKMTEAVAFLKDKINIVRNGSDEAAAAVDLDKDGPRLKTNEVSTTSGFSPQVRLGASPSSSHILSQGQSSLKFRTKDMRESSSEKQTPPGYGGRRKRTRSKSPPHRGSSSRSPYKKHHRSKSPSRSGHRFHEDNLREFRLEESKLRSLHYKEMENYLNDPESHPLYKPEWTKFWENLYSNIERRGGDPNYYDFRSDWIPYWKKRMQDLCHMEFINKRKKLLLTYNMEDPDNKKYLSSYSNLKKREISQAVEDRSQGNLEGSPSLLSQASKEYEKRRQSDPQTRFCESEFSVVGTLKLLVDLEGQLGSLVHQLKALLKVAIVVTDKGRKPVEIFEDDSNISLLKVACSELHTHMNSGFLEAVTYERIKKALEATNWLISEAAKNMLGKSYETQFLFGLDLNLMSAATAGMDDIEIAQYIAQQLLNIGKSDATEKELHDILTAVSSRHLNLKKSRHEGAVADAAVRCSVQVSQPFSGDVKNSDDFMKESSHSASSGPLQQSEKRAPLLASPGNPSVSKNLPVSQISSSYSSGSVPLLFPSGVATSVVSDIQHTSISKSGLKLIESSYEETINEEGNLSQTGQKKPPDLMHMIPQRLQSGADNLKFPDTPESKRSSRSENYLSAAASSPLMLDQLRQSSYGDSLKKSDYELSSESFDDEQLVDSNSNNDKSCSEKSEDQPHSKNLKSCNKPNTFRDFVMKPGSSASMKSSGQYSGSRTDYIHLNRELFSAENSYSPSYISESFRNLNTGFSLDEEPVSLNTEYRTSSQRASEVNSQVMNYHTSLRGGDNTSLPHRFPHPDPVHRFSDPSLYSRGIRPMHRGFRGPRFM